MLPLAEVRILAGWLLIIISAATIFPLDDDIQRRCNLLASGNPRRRSQLPTVANDEPRMEWHHPDQAETRGYRCLWKLLLYTETDQGNKNSMI